MVSTDTGSYAPGEGHPQIAGSFPRYLHKMVVERGELSWEQAVYHTTLLPAQTMGFSRKGRIRTGMDADLLVFDPETIRDRADFPGLGRPDARAGRYSFCHRLRRSRRRKRVGNRRDGGQSDGFI